MAKFTDYTEKTEPVDTDLALIYDTPAKVNKKFTFGNLWKWIAKKIVSEGISQLDTTNKTIPGAINELNSKTITYKDIDIDISTLTMQQNFGGYYANIPVIDYLKADKLIYSIFIIKWSFISTYTAVCLDTSATNITIYQATNSKQGILKIRIVYKK
jgi:hypothetical protein